MLRGQGRQEDNAAQESELFGSSEMARWKSSSGVGDAKG
jgi:hypothetical protein